MNGDAFRRLAKFELDVLKHGMSRSSDLYVGCSARAKPDRTAVGQLDWRPSTTAYDRNHEFL